MKPYQRIAFCMTLAATVAVAHAKDYKYESVDGDPMRARIYTLDNGLKVYLSVNKEEPRVTAHIAVNTGSRNDPAETTGLAHYLEHLMFKGTKKFGTTDYEAEKPYLDKISSLYEEYRGLTDTEQRKAKYHEIDSVSQLAARYFIPNEYDKMMALIGSDESNAYTSYDHTVYVESVPVNELERWAMVQSDRFQNMVMRGFHTELEAVYEEKNISMASDREKSFDAMMTQLFPAHPYGTQTVIGTQEHLKNPSQVNIQNYYNKYYRPNNVAICMAGDLEFDAAIALIDRYFGAWERGNDVTAPQFAPLAPLTQPKDTTVLGQETEYVTLAWRLKKAASLQGDTVVMVDKLLNNGDVGLIDLDLNQKMKVMEAGGGVAFYKDYGIFELNGMPNEGQTLEEVRALLLEELDKIKRGEWDEKLLTSIVRNRKLSELKRLDNNDARAEEMSDTYITGVDWKQNVEQIDRMARLTKHDITSWAKEHLDEGYVCVYKRKGEDNSQAKMEKPAITPIPSNRDYKSKMLKEYETMQVQDIQPQFVDFKKELTFGTTKKKLPVIYKQNTNDARFTLTYRYDFGTEADRRYGVAADLTNLFGTDKLTVEDIKRRFYDLACNYRISVGSKSLTIGLSGLHENMAEAMLLLDEILNNLKADKEVYRQYVGQVMKARMESRTSQGECYNALVAYGTYGKHNPYTDVLTPAEFNDTDPKVFMDLIKGLAGVKHEVLYWGPASLKDMMKAVDKYHTTANRLSDAPANKPYEQWHTTQNEVLVAPYDAKNINMRMLSIEGKPLNLDREPVVTLFNEYFGGSMNSVVFQELRESRALAYNAYASYVTPNRKDGHEHYMQHIISQNDKMMDCIKVFKEITDELPQSDVALNTVKSSMMKSIAASRTVRYGVISQYIIARDLGVDYDIDSMLYKKIPQLTLSDIVNFEKEDIMAKPMRYVIVGKTEDLDMHALDQVGKVTVLTLDDIFPAYK